MEGPKQYGILIDWHLLTPLTPRDVPCQPTDEIFLRIGRSDEIVYGVVQVAVREIAGGQERELLCEVVRVDVGWITHSIT